MSTVVKFTISDEETEKFEYALSEISRITHREHKRSDFARFCFMWFINGLLRDDVGDDKECAISAIDKNGLLR